MTTNKDFLEGKSVGMRPVMVLKKAEAEGNPFGFERMEILCFNVDGQGAALVRREGGALEPDDEVTVEIYSSEEVWTLVAGGDGDGNHFYREVALPEE